MSRSVSWEIAICALVLMVGVVANYDDRPTYEGLEATVVAEPFLDGGALVYRWSGTVTRNCTGALRREVRQGDEVFYLPERTFTWIPEDRWSGKSEQSFLVAVSLGDFEGRLVPGAASYHVTQVSHCNRIQAWLGHTIQEKYPPVMFTVSERS
jgi:hypothetical protein